MMSVRGHGLFSCCLMTILAALLSGCTIGGKSFTMDSNSRVPFFGLELKERKSKSAAPVYRSIARSSDSANDVKVALQISPANGKRTRKRDERPTPLSFSEIEAGSARSTVGRRKWAGENPGSEQDVVESIPLPRTDEKSRSAERVISQTNIDFQ